MISMDEAVEFVMYMLIHRFVNVYAKERNIYLTEAIDLICYEYKFIGDRDELVARVKSEMKLFCSDVEARQKYLAGYISFVVDEVMDLNIGDDVKSYYMLEN